MNCDICGIEAKSNAGLAAHKRSHKTEAEPTETGELPVVSEPASTNPSTLLSMKGWSAKSDGQTHWVEDEMGRRIGTFPTPQEAIRFLENTNRWIR